MRIDSIADNDSTSFQQEVNEGARFKFGNNWLHFLKTLSDTRINIAVNSLQKYLGDIKNKTFLDVGSGSGLFSLCARKLGALVFSIDYDPKCVACTNELKSCYFPNDSSWNIREGSVLDNVFLKALGQYDIVYSWGVLHHTGELWQAMENVHMLVKDGGTLFIALYNEQYRKSRYWWKIKQLYNSNKISRFGILSFYIPIWTFRSLLSGIIKYRNPMGLFIHYKKNRGMSLWNDWIDWLGGFPFEVASPETVVDFYVAKGYALKKITTTNSLGCNQFIFEKGL